MAILQALWCWSLEGELEIRSGSLANDLRAPVHWSQGCLRLCVQTKYSDPEALARPEWYPVGSKQPNDKTHHVTAVRLRSMETTAQIPLYLSGLVLSTILCMLFLDISLLSALWVPRNTQENILIINLTNQQIINNLMTLTCFLFSTFLYST